MIQSSSKASGDTKWTINDITTENVGGYDYYVFSYTRQYLDNVPDGYKWYLCDAGNNRMVEICISFVKGHEDVILNLINSFYKANPGV